MPLEPGTNLGPYRIDAPLGAGGMGEVYRATDTRLDRTVAIKVLPEHVASDPDLKQRFEREAKAISSLSHPNICTLHDVGHQDGLDFLVMEHLEGESLADRLQKGALPLDQAVRYAGEIADALDKAHRQGIVHRDLKPANVFLTKAGSKLLDFGLAKRTQTNVKAELTSLASMPTQEQPLTQQGMMLGTRQYMAPEQLEGQPADARSDIFTFGAIVYEMVTGRRAFEGQSQLSVMSAILEHDPPPMAELVDMTPPALDRVVRTCLAKDPDDRWQTAGDIARQLAWVTEEGPVAAQAAARLWQRPVPLVIGLLLLMVAAAFVARTLTGPAAPGPEPVRRMSIVLPPSQDRGGGGLFRTVAISPTGSHVAYAASNQLYLRALDELEATPIEGTEGSGSRAPFFSPDGQWIGFYSTRDRALQKVPLTGGRPTTLCTRDDGCGTGGGGGSNWGPDDWIVFAQGGIRRVSGAGGAPEMLVEEDPSARVSYPQMLPDGETVLYTIGSRERPFTRRVVAERIATGERTVVLEGMGADPAATRYLPSGHLVYGERYALMAVPFDVERLEVTGGAVPLVDGVDRGPLHDKGGVNADVSASGDVAYLSADAGGSRRRLVWVDREGNEEMVAAPPRAYIITNLSPDGRRVAVSTADEEEDIWVWDFERQTFTRFTASPEIDQFNVWTPDGERIVFSSWRDLAARNLYWGNADGTGTIERLTESPNDQFPTTISPDGSQLVFAEFVRGRGRDLHVLMLDDERRVEPLIATEFQEQYPQISPDGRWLAYQTNPTRSTEVFVQPFPNVDDGRWQISQGGGQVPMWRQDGRELFYRGEAGVMAVPIDTAGDFAAGAPELVFDDSSYGLGYAAAPDGQRFLMIRDNDPNDAFGGLMRIHVVLNWHEELNALVPSGE